MKAKQTRQTKQLQQTEPYGMIELNWNKLVLSLDKAHILQKLLCDVVSVETVYGKGTNKTIHAIKAYDVPEVKVVDVSAMVDARCLGKKKYDAWRKTVAERDEGVETFLSPEEFDLFCDEQ